MMWNLRVFAQSLRYQILLPIAVASLFLAVLAITGIHILFQQQLTERVNSRGELISNTINYVTESISRGGELQRIITSLGAEPEVEQIIVLQGSPLRIIAATQPPLLGKKLTDLEDKDLIADIQGVITTQQTYRHFVKSKYRYEVATALLLSKSGDISQNKGVVLVHLNTQAAQWLIDRLTLLYSIAVLLGILILSGFSYFLLSKKVLQPLHSIKTRVQRIAIGSIDEAWPETQNPNEIGVLANALQFSTASTVKAMLELARQTDDLLASESELVAAKEGAERANAAKSAFLANMSHEIRTPLNAVLGFSELLNHTELNSEQLEFVRAIDVGGHSLLAQINDLLDFSKIEAGKLTLEKIDFDLRYMVEDSVELVSAKAQQKSLELVCLIDASVPQKLRGDPNRLRQILLNLLNNAIKFTSEGVIVMRVRSTALSNQLQRVYVEVKDSGVGMSEDEKTRLFQPFSQADVSTTRRFGGTGLGLSICRLLVEAMQGKIDVNSSPNKGSTFWFEVILETGQAVEPLERQSIALQGKRALLVDDLAANRELLTMQLESMGMVVAAVIDSTSIVHALADSDPFDIAFIGKPMGDLEGNALAAEIHAMPQHLHLPLVLLTTMGEAGQAAAAQAAGYAAFLNKPIRSLALSRCVELALKLQAVPAVVRPLVTIHQAAEQAAADKAYILLVEDNLVNQKVAVKMLEKLNCRVDVAVDGLQGVMAVAQQKYDLVFMDCQMPNMDGFAATQAIRASESVGQRLPIVALTANAFKEDVDRCTAAGMDDFISKPITIQALKAAINRWITDGALRE